MLGAGQTNTRPSRTCKKPNKREGSWGKTQENRQQIYHFHTEAEDKRETERLQGELAEGRTEACTERSLQRRRPQQEYPSKKRRVFRSGISLAQHRETPSKAACSPMNVPFFACLLLEPHSASRAKHKPTLSTFLFFFSSFQSTFPKLAASI